MTATDAPAIGPGRALTSPRLPQATAWAIVLITVAGLFLRFLHLGQASLWIDEGFSAWIISLDLPALLQAARHDTAPPLYYLLLKGWAGLFGDSEMALRSLSALASGLCIPLAAMTVWRLTGSRAGALAAAVMLAFSSRQVQMAQQARTYALLTLALFVCLHCLAQRSQGGDRARRWLLPAAIAAAAGLWMHNIAVLYVAGLNLVYLLMPSEVAIRRRLLELAGFDAAVLLAYAPWIPSLLFQLRSVSGRFWTPVPDGAILADTLVDASGVALRELSAALGARPPLAGVVLVTMALLLALAYLRPRNQNPHQRCWATALTALAFAPIALAFILAHLGAGVFVRKSFMLSEAPLVLIFGLAASMPVRRWLPSALLLLLLAGSAVCLWAGPRSAGGREDWRSVVSYINTYPDDSVLAVYVSTDAECLYPYYTRRLGQQARAVTGAPHSFFAGNPPRAMERVLADADLDDLRATLDQLRPQHVLLILSNEPFADADHRTQKLLDARMRRAQAGVRHFRGCDVVEYGVRE